MRRIQILLEPEQYKILIDITKQEKRSLSDIIREMVNKQLAERKRQALALAAQSLLADYQSDPELIASQALNGDNFNA